MVLRSNRQVSAFRGESLEAPLNLPAELTRFLDRRAPQALLVRGAPGTGKTLLAISLLKAFRGRGIYVSSRTRTAQLDFDYPDLGPMIEAGRLAVVDMVTGGSALRDASRALGSAQNLVKEDTGESLRALLLPPEVLEAWSESSPTAPTLVVLDSWDAIIERYLGGAGRADDAPLTREEVERIAITQMAEAPVTLVFVVEHREAGQLEYLVNGIVSMERQTVDDRMERWLRIDKLRGTRISHPSYPFSLEGGRLQCIEPLSTDSSTSGNPGDPAPEQHPGQIWPGSTDYASHFGWLGAGKLTLFEHDPDVPNAAIRLLLAPMMNQTVAQGGRVFHIPPPGMHATELWHMYEGRTSRKAFSEQVRIVSALPTGESDEFGSVILPLPSGTMEGYNPRIPEAAKFLREGADLSHPNLGVLSIAGMRAVNSLVPNTYTEHTMPGLALTYFHQSPLHAVIIGPEDDTLTQSVRTMAATHLRLTCREGRILIHGINPWTPWLVLSEQAGDSPYRFLVVV